MFKTDIALDIGSMNTKIASRSGVRNELTCLALDSNDGFRVIASGNETTNILGTVTAYPIRNGTVANMRLAAIYLKYIAREITGRKKPSSVFIHSAIPEAIGNMKKNAIKETVRLAGFRGIKFHNAHIMGAIGAGVDVSGQRAHMIVNVGKDTLSISVIANGGVIWESISGEGSSLMDRAIQAFFREHHRVIIGEKVAQTIKHCLNSSLFTVDGRSIANGMPVTVTASGAQIRDALTHGADEMAAAIADSIKSIPIEAAADLLETGITLIGGGALQYGLAERFSQTLGVPARTAHNAGSAVIEGMHICVFGKRTYGAGRSAELTAAAE